MKQLRTEASPVVAPNGRAANRGRPVFTAIATVLALAFFLAALSESLLKSPSSDEPPHIASGLSYVSTGVFRGNLQHPPFLKELSGISLLLGGIRWPRTPETDAFIRGAVPRETQPEWGIGNNIIIQNGPDRTLFWARLPFLIIASFGGLLVYFLGRELIGGLPALCAAFLYFADPTILGQSFTVTMDVGLAVFSLLFLFTLWRYLRNATAKRLAICGVTLGLMLCVKFSAPLIAVAAVILLLTAVVWPPAPEKERRKTLLDPFYAEPGDTLSALRSRPKVGRNDPCPCGSGKKYKACHADVSLINWLAKRWTASLLPLMVMGLIAVAVIELVYFFPSDPLAYVHGMQLVNADHTPDYPHYFDGELKPKFPGYFGFAYLLKEPAAAILLALAGIVPLLRRRSITPLARFFLLAPPLMFFIGTSLLADEIGIRYIMPVLPFAHLIGGVALATLFTAAAKWLRWIAIVCCAWLMLAVVGTYPDHLSYFNESACLLTDPGKLGLDGGSKCGVYWLDDSNVDWGQGYKQLRAWLGSHEKGRAIRLATPFAFPPEAYGIKSDKAEPMELATRPRAGELYVVSATDVARVPAVPGATDWLRRDFTAVIGHALYVYDIPK